MKHIQPQSRYNIFWAVMLCYLFPFVGLSSIGAIMGRTPKNWLLLCIALLLTSIGSLALYWLMAKWESAWKKFGNKKAEPCTAEQSDLDSEEKFPSLNPSNGSVHSREEILAAENALKEVQEKNFQLQAEITSLTNELQQLSKDKEQFQTHLHRAISEADSYKQTCLQQQEQYKVYFTNLQNQLTEQKQQSEKKQYQITHLETKVADLTYEIKTLLQIAERHLEPDNSFASDKNVFAESVDTSGLSSDDKLIEIHHEKSIGASERASLQLKRCLDIAQKITGSSRFNTQISSFLDSPADSFTIDLRRLCDTLRSENNSTIILYSPKENQPLFVNNHIKETTGWSPEKFIQNFNEIIQDSLIDWRQGLASLSLKPETALQLSLKTKSGSSILVKAQLAFIPTGIFRHYAIAVFYV